MRRFPEWLRREVPMGTTLGTNETISKHRLNTVCDSAICPNRLECYSQKTATFMILGDICTRRCGFCAIPVGKPHAIDEQEPLRVARAAKQLGLKHVVITSVARDDLKDEGADAFYETITAVRNELPESTIEVLTPDFHAKSDLIERVCQARPDVFNHNVETVSRLTPVVRPQAKYQRSLDVISTIKSCDGNIMTKSGFMLGLGETLDEVRQTMHDLRSAGCDILTIGQYLKPKEGKLEIHEFVAPSVFSELAQAGKTMGFAEVYAGPYVRSSYHAGEAYERSQHINNGTRYVAEQTSF